MHQTCIIDTKFFHCTDLIKYIAQIAMYDYTVTISNLLLSCKDVYMKNSKFLAITFLLLAVMVTPAFAIDSTALNSEAVLGSFIQKGVGGGVPVGTVVTWASWNNPTDPENWLECNGQGVSASTYPELYAIVGANVPNYAGVFLRGHGSQSHTQNNGSTVGTTATTHSSGNLGQVQGDATRNITGYIRTSNAGFYGNSGVFNYHQNGEDTKTKGNSSAADLSIDFSRSTPTASENRPANVAVRYLIRAKN